MIIVILRRFIGAAMATALSLSAAYDQEAPAVRKYLTRPGFRWTCEGKLTFRFCYPPGLESIAVNVKRDVRESLVKSLRLAGASSYTSKPLIYLFLLESEGRLEELTHVSAYGASQPRDHAIFVVSGHRETLNHELNHEILTTLWGPAEPWIAEGFAAYAAGLDVDGQCRRLFESHGYLPLANMVDPAWNASIYPASKIYPELGSFVKYLRETRGIPHLRQVWRLGSRSLTRVYGNPCCSWSTNGKLRSIGRDW